MAAQVQGTLVRVVRFERVDACQIEKGKERILKLEEARDEAESSLSESMKCEQSVCGWR